MALSHAPILASKPALILLVRHGATEWSVVGRHTGRTDLALTELGVRQAVALGPLIRSLLGGAAPVVATSPLLRSRATAQSALPDERAVVLDDLAEFDYGDYEGLVTDEIYARDPTWDLFTTGCPNGETVQQATDRCDAVVAWLAREAPGRAAVLFTHGHIGRLLTARQLRLAPTAAASLWNDTATIGVINEHRGQLVLVGWNLRPQGANPQHVAHT